MATTRRLILAGLPALLFLSLAACAGRGPALGSEGDTVLVVENNLIPSTMISVYAIPSSGARSLVGFAQPSTTTVLRFNATAGSYRFVAETAAGAVVAETEVPFSRGATIEWDLEADIATIAGV
jgi:hypothetical protein